MNIALLFAGGKGSRMHTSNIPKQFMEVFNKPIIIYTIECFERNENIDAIAVVCIESWLDKLKQLISENNIKKVRWVVAGDVTGQKSIYNGLKAISDDIGEENHIVLISDGVRPVLEDKIILQNIECVKKYGSSVTVCPVTETIVEVNEDNEIEKIPRRSKCYLSKAPQGFYLSEIMNAHRSAISEEKFDCTNSAELIRRYGHSLHVVYDTDENIKVTTPTDIAIMKYILKKNEE